MHKTKVDFLFRVMVCLIFILSEILGIELINFLILNASSKAFIIILE